MVFYFHQEFVTLSTAISNRLIELSSDIANGMRNCCDQIPDDPDKGFDSLLDRHDYNYNTQNNRFNEVNVD